MEDNIGKVIITGQDLTLEQVVRVCRKDEEVTLDEKQIEAVMASRHVADLLVEEERIVYGVTTGFGKFCDQVISKSESKTLQRNLIISHAVGAGNNFDRDIVRAIMLLRVNNLAKGFSGVRLETIETLIKMLNRKVTPVIPEKGSLGASGDLVPLAHMVLPMEYKMPIPFGVHHKFMEPVKMPLTM